MLEFNDQRPTWTTINLSRLEYNFRSVVEFINRKIEYLAVVKADAYGHGAVRCARILAAAGVNWFGVALPEEGLELRENDIETPILCLGGFWQNQGNLLLQNNLTPVIYRLEQAENLQQCAAERNVVADIHLKIDTGMGRIGVRYDAVREFAERLKTFKNLRVEGVMTHFAAADDLSENAFTARQISRFDDAVKIIEQFGFHPRYIDLANSPGAIGHPEALGNMVRLGGILYGLGDDALSAELAKPNFKPVLSLHSRIAHLKIVPKGETLGYSRTFETGKDSLIATIPIGYEDGFRRGLSNRARVIVNDCFAPVVGRISMDWTLVDVSEIANVRVGDEVILIGASENQTVTAADLARLTDTISYEITCGINRRVNRKYAESE